MLKKDLLDHIIYVAKFQIATRNYGSGLSYFQKQYGTENVIHTHTKEVRVDVDKTHLSAGNVDFEEVDNVDTLNWFYNCIETGVYTNPPAKQYSKYSSVNTEMFNEFIN